MGSDDESTRTPVDSGAEVDRDHVAEGTLKSVGNSAVPPEEGDQESKGTTRMDENELNPPSKARKNYVDLTMLIRSVQRAEGHRDCFRQVSSCEEMDCRWRSYCLDSSLRIT